MLFVPTLSIVTVVKDDLPGLQRTLQSTRILPEGSYEHWVIDGSSNSAIREFLLSSNGINWISEPDSGIYDAMNKGLERAKGNFVFFLNAGDQLSRFIKITELFARLSSETRVIIGHIIEYYRRRRWLRPGLGREGDVFTSPAHQATFYPKQFYTHNRYRVQIPVRSDAEYSTRAIRHSGAVYFPSIISEFELGGISTRYDSFWILRLRVGEVTTMEQRGRIVVKYLLWHLFPRSLFYGLLASRKYTRIKGEAIPSLPRLDLAISKDVNKGGTSFWRS